MGDLGVFSYSMVRLCLLGCRALLLIAVTICAIVIGSILSGKPYVVGGAGEECRLTYVTDDVVAVGGGEIAKYEKTIVFASTRNHSAELIDYNGTNNMWARFVPNADLPDYCLYSSASNDENNDPFVDGDEGGQWGVVFILPAISWAVLKNLGGGLEVYYIYQKLHGNDRSKFFSVLNWLLLTWIPNGLLVPIASLTDSETVQGVFISHIGTSTNIATFSSIAFVLATAAFIYGQLNHDDCGIFCNASANKAPCYQRILVSPCCACLCCLPVLVVYFIYTGKNLAFILMISFNFSLNWPGLQIAMTLSAQRVLCFVLSLLEYVNLAMTVVNFCCRQD